MAQIVIADASPLIILAHVEGLGWLQLLFGQVWITSEVRDEILPGTGKPGENAIHSAIKNGILRVFEQSWETPLFPTLDEGEASTIRAALAHPDDKCLLLMDERLGRTIAGEQGLSVVGAAGVIGMAKIRGLIPSAREVFERLLKTDFRISPDVIRGVLKKTGERA
jgi:predicted nucleic acid-binding protein